MKETLTMIPLLTLRNHMILKVYIKESINNYGTDSYAHNLPKHMPAQMM